MAKSPKNDKDLPDETSADEPVAQDAIEDAVVIEDTETTDEGLDVSESADAEGGVNDDDTASSDVSEGIDTPDAVDEGPQKEADQADRKSGGMAGVIALLLGGVIAGGVGFGAAQYSTQSWPFAAPAPEQDPVAVAMDGANAQIAELAERVGANSQSIAALKGDTSVDELGGQLRADIVATQSRMEEMAATLDALDGRLSELEKMPQGDGAAAAEAASQAYQRELTEMRAMLESEIAALNAKQEEAATLEVNAAEAAKAASARAAMSRIMAALESGQPFGDALFDLSTATGMDAPQGLAVVAENGVPTLASLQDAFPDAARGALDEALREMVANGEIGRGEAFLRTQLGTRSLEPKEGDDPDAILSRAEFALKNGQIGEALEEVGALPDAAQPALADWKTMAETRLAALDAGATLAQELNK